MRRPLAVVGTRPPLLSDGLPFEFTAFTGPHKNQLPLNLEVVGFAKG